MPKKTTIEERVEKELRRTYITQLHLENFRGYSKETQINFGRRLTLFFGKGSVGKTTILDALTCLNV